jgi:hypothetical protein
MAAWSSDTRSEATVGLIWLDHRELDVRDGAGHTQSAMHAISIHSRRRDMPLTGYVGGA